MVASRWEFDVSFLSGKSPEEIRKTFNIKNDFTPEEEEQVYIYIYRTYQEVEQVSGCQIYCQCTVESLIKDTQNKGNNLHVKDTFRCTNNELAYSGNTFFTSKERTTSLQWTK